jgi:hypothetical protein
MKKASESKKRDSVRVLRQERRRFITGVGGALGAAALAPDLLASSAAARIRPVLARPVVRETCPTTLTYTTFLKLGSRTTTSTSTTTPPTTGGGPGNFTNTQSATISGTATASFTRSGNATVTANGTNLTFTITYPRTAVTVTASYTTKTECMAQVAALQHEPADLDIDESASLGKLCILF